MLILAICNCTHVRVYSNNLQRKPYYLIHEPWWIANLYHFTYKRLDKLLFCHLINQTTQAANIYITRQTIYMLPKNYTCQETILDPDPGRAALQG